MYLPPFWWLFLYINRIFSILSAKYQVKNINIIGGYFAASGNYLFGKIHVFCQMIPIIVSIKQNAIGNVLIRFVAKHLFTSLYRYYFMLTIRERARLVSEQEKRVLKMHSFLCRYKFKIWLIGRS